MALFSFCMYSITHFFRLPFSADGRDGREKRELSFRCFTFWHEKTRPDRLAIMNAGRIFPSKEIKHE
jgi:hypothetical protein